MKKIIVILIGILFLAANAFALDVSAEFIDEILEGPNYFTDGFPNGEWMMEGLTGGDDTQQTYYIIGVLDYIEYTRPELEGKLYPGYSRGDVMDAVKGYYRNNPDKRDRTVIQVILSGCK